MGYLVKHANTFVCTKVGWSVLTCDDFDEAMRIMQEVHLLHDLDVERDQLEPFEETLRAFGVWP